MAKSWECPRVQRHGWQHFLYLLHKQFALFIPVFRLRFRVEVAWGHATLSVGGDVRTPYCLLLTLYFVMIMPSLAHKLKPLITFWPHYSKVWSNSPHFYMFNYSTHIHVIFIINLWKFTKSLTIVETVQSPQNYNSQLLQHQKQQLLQQLCNCCNTRNNNWLKRVKPYFAKGETTIV